MGFSDKPDWPNSGGSKGRGILLQLGLLLILLGGVGVLLVACQKQTAAPPEYSEADWEACRASPDPDCLYAKMLALAIAGPDSEGPDFSLRQIMTGFARAGEFKMAMTVAPLIATGTDRDMALVDTAARQARAGMFEEAIELARTLEDPAPGATDDPDSGPRYHTRSWALGRISAEFTDQGRLGEALDLAREIDEPNFREKALAAVALALAGIGDTEEALSLAGDIGNAERRDETIVGISATFARTGNLSKAYSYRDRLTTDGARAVLLAEIAALLAVAGKTSEAEELARDAIGVLPPVKEGDYKPNDQTRRVAERIAAALATPDLFLMAFQTADAYLLISERHRSKTRALLKLVSDGYPDLAFGYLSGVEDDETHDTALVAIIGKLASNGREENIRRYKQRIRTRTGHIKAWLAVLDAKSKAGRFDEAVNQARQTLSVSDRMDAFEIIATDLVAAGRTESAVPLILEAREFIRPKSEKKHHTRNYASRLLRVAKLLTMVGERDAALDASREAMERLESDAFSANHIDDFAEILAMLMRRQPDA
jgi:tetratricopeptide (TPR) repeat protein